MISASLRQQVATRANGRCEYGRVTARILGFNRVELVTDRARLIRLGNYNDT